MGLFLRVSGPEIILIFDLLRNNYIIIKLLLIIILLIITMETQTSSQQQAPLSQQQQQQASLSQQQASLSQQQQQQTPSKTSLSQQQQQTPSQSPQAPSQSSQQLGRLIPVVKKEEEMGSYRSQVIKDDISCEGREDFFVNIFKKCTLFFSFFLFYRFSKIRAKRHISI